MLFEDILGHEKQLDILKKDINENNISHAYLFSGPKGIGKYTIAKEFAKELLKTDSLDTCPDYVYISKKDDKKDILTEQIRENVIENIYTKPIITDKKIYIIDEAEYLNVSSQNTLLKVLEEPPEFVVIILVTSNMGKMLPTIISRLNKINFNKLEDKYVEEYVKNKLDVNLEKDIIQFVDGSIGQAIEVNNCIQKFDNVKKLYNGILNKDPVACFKLSEDIDFKSQLILDYLQHILYINNNFESALVIEETKTRLASNGNYEIVIDNMILKFINNI